MSTDTIKTPEAILLEARLAAGLSRDALGAAVGVTGSTIYRMEAEGVIPKPRTLARIVEALRIDPAELHRSLVASPAP